MIRLNSLQQARSLLIATPAPTLILGFAAWRIGTLKGWATCLGILGIISFYGWFANERQRRALANTPTARIGSAPQGYVELNGSAKVAGQSLVCPITLLPCVWYRCLTERDRDHNNRYEYESEDESAESFLLDDGSGEVLVYPEHAQIEAGKPDVRIEGDFRYTIWTIRAGQPLLVLGDFISVRGDENLDFRRDVSQRLAEMKQDKAELLRRFDLNRDGEIDLAEWEAARAAAANEIRAEYRSLQAATATHVLRNPASGQLFLITTRSEKRMLRGYRLWRWYHLLVLLAALLFLWQLQHDPTLLGRTNQ